MGINGLAQDSYYRWWASSETRRPPSQGQPQRFEKQLNYSDVGGAVLFGVKAPVVKTHGSSDAKAVYSTIRQIRTMLETDVVAQTAREFSGE